MSGLTDKELLRQFRDLTLPESEWNHFGRLRLAWLYLLQFDPESASLQIAADIETYANSLKPDNKYHFTITKASMLIVHDRMRARTHIDFDDFVQANPDLVSDFPSLIRRHYSPELLATPEAKYGYVEPDIEPFNTTPVDPGRQVAHGTSRPGTAKGRHGKETIP